MILIALAAAAALAGAEPAAATPAAPPAKAAAKDQDPIVCHDDPVPNSRIPTRICLRKSVAEQMARDSARALSQMQTTTAGKNPAAGN
jgi:hypothetical protein